MSCRILVVGGKRRLVRRARGLADGSKFVAVSNSIDVDTVEEEVGRNAVSNKVVTNVLVSSLARGKAGTRRQETTLDTANHVAVRVVTPGDRPVLHERNGHVLPASITGVTVGRKIGLGTGVSTKSIKPKKKDSKGGNRTICWLVWWKI
ncbi:hypothetical protein V6N13_080082 [Hibiscus sabdariffa]